MKRIWMTTERPKNYASIRAGLGYITKAELEDFDESLCHKIFTTRTHPLKGEYIVVEGSHYNAKPVEPMIAFSAKLISVFSFNDEISFHLKGWLEYVTHRSKFVETWPWMSRYTFSELDLGWKGATFEDLKNKLLELNPKATLDTDFYVNLMERV